MGKGVRKRGGSGCLQETDCKDADDDDFLAEREFEREDQGDGEDEDHEVGYDCDSGVGGQCLCWREGIRGDGPCVCPPGILGLAERRNDGKIPDGFQGDAVCEGGDGGPEACDGDGEDQRETGSASPLDGEDCEIEQTDGDLGERECEDVEEQREPPCLCARVSFLAVGTLEMGVCVYLHD